MNGIFQLQKIIEIVILRPNFNLKKKCVIIWFKYVLLDILYYLYIKIIYNYMIIILNFTH